MGVYTHKDYAALQDKVVTDGVARPSYERRVNENALIRNLDSYAGQWTNRSVFWNFRNDAATQAYSQYNWRNPLVYKLSYTNSPSWDGLGFTGNGSNQALNTGWAPNLSGAAGFNLSTTVGASFTYDLLTNASGIHFGANGVSTFWNQINGLTMTVRINQNSGLNVGPLNPGAGHWIINKTAAASQEYYKNGVLDDSDSSNETSSLNGNAIYIFCRNDNGTAATFSACKIGSLSFGAAVTDTAKFYACIVQFKLL